MLKWEIKNGDDKLRAKIKNAKEGFDAWYNSYWKEKCSKERMLSKYSPVEHIYYKMTKTFEEVKKKYPYDAKQECSSCGEYVDKWIETEFSFCNEYGCGMSLCKECAEKFKSVIDKL